MLLSDEHLMIRQVVRSLAEKEFKPLAAEVDQHEKFPHKNVKLLADQGLIGVDIPVEYGGGGADSLSHLIVIEEVARVCASTSVVLTTTGLAVGPLLAAGTEEQKKKFLTPIASGACLGAFAITEPGAGSDNSNMRTIAVRDGDSYVINGSKIFITNAGEAGLISVIARTKKEGGYKGISVFMVEQGTPGLIIGKKEDKMGMRGSETREVVLEDCRVPVENMIGEENLGFYVLMESFNHSRPGVGAQALGIAQGAFEAALQYAKERIQFNQPIVKFQAIQMMLADMAIQIEAARQLVYHSAVLLDRDGEKASSETIQAAAMGKVFASDTAMKVTVDAVQIFGGYGYVKEYPVERMMRDAKITQIWEGTNQILRTIIVKELAGRY
ncbi:MAG: acyl-CoA dehydrogenase [Firmicutes bacterium]|nr:acyl-CoA dehydrogenase [Bacillota bacterium]